MSYKDNLRPASFRGTPFLVDSHDFGGGRRGEQHEYPQRDEPYFEDLGLKAREYRIEAYVLGDDWRRQPGPDYMQRRDALLFALETEGPGELIHPYYGSLDVVATEFRLRESRAEGGKASFSIVFAAAGENRFPTASIDSRVAVGTAADGASTAIQQGFGERFHVDARPAFVANAAVSLGQKFVASINSIIGRNGVLQSLLPPLNRNLDAYRLDLSFLVTDVPAYALNSIGLQRDLAALFTDPIARIRGMLALGLWGDALPAVTGVTASRLLQAANQAAFVDLTRQGAVIEAARASSAATFDSIDSALAVRDELAARLDDEMTAAGDAFQDDVHTALADLRTAVITDITARGADLGHYASLTPLATQPAALIAYRLYGDATRADEIVARNDIRHPGFVPGGRPLKVLAP